MAPPPEYDKEPKAPDKSDTNIASEELLNSLDNDQHPNLDLSKPSVVAALEVENNKHVEGLDDGQLRALLDEAITYKNPKDREGKSNLFKELLEEVEVQEEQAVEEAARTLSGCRGAGGAGAGRRGGARGRRALPHSSSMQDLVAAALAAEPAPRRHRHAPPSVSARAIHGGSLPSGVDTSSLLCEEPARGGYLATVRCVNPPPLAERRVSASDANAPAEMELLNRKNKPLFPMTYTARATLEIGSGSVSSGRAVTTTTASNQVDSAISFSCITTPEVVSGCSTTASGGQSGAPADSKPRSVVATSFNGLPLARHNYGALAPPPDDTKKSLDENGNSVQGFSSPLSGSSQHKKPRRKKSSKNETVIDCQQIDGYQGDKDVNELLRFIESDAEPARAKLRKHRDDADDKHKKRCERRKDKDGAKSKRAASLEELSRTSLAELTAPAPRPPAPAPPPAPPAPPAPAPLELTDFQTVTKRRRARRRGEEAGRSAPARSADSTEDTDGASPPPAAPAASYAEIARARTAIPDLISSCTGAAALPAGRARRKPPDVLAARPAVVLRAPPDRADLHGVTFGFELNHQLLAPRRADALRYLPPAPPADPLPLQTLVEYVGAAWEDVVRCGGEVRYFGE